MPSAVAYFTLTGEVEAADSVTVKVPRPAAAALPSAKVASPIASVGGAATSSLVMLPTPVAPARVAPLGFLSTTLKLSVASTTESPIATISIVLRVSPAAKVIEPDFAT